MFNNDVKLSLRDYNDHHHLPLHDRAYRNVIETSKFEPAWLSITYGRCKMYHNR